MVKVHVMEDKCAGKGALFRADTRLLRTRLDGDEL